MVSRITEEKGVNDFLNFILYSVKIINSSLF